MCVKVIYSDILVNGVKVGELGGSQGILVVLDDRTKRRE